MTETTPIRARARRTSFVAATEAFENASSWLSTEDEPALTTLYAIAEELDEGDRTPALVAQYGLTYRSLLKRAPQVDEGAGDPLEEALRAAG